MREIKVGDWVKALVDIKMWSTVVVCKGDVGIVKCVHEFDVPKIRADWSYNQGDEAVADGIWTVDASDVVLVEKSNHQQRVERFMAFAGQDVPEMPSIPPSDVRVLRARLILEEAIETIRALGCDVTVDPGNLEYIVVDAPWIEPNLIEIVDGCCDIKVVTTGTLSACGIKDTEPQRLVDEANLKKFGPGGHRREDGKWVKPPDWVAPDWVKEIQRQKGADLSDEA